MTARNSPPRSVDKWKQILSTDDATMAAGRILSTLRRYNPLTSADDISYQNDLRQLANALIAFANKKETNASGC